MKGRSPSRVLRSGSLLVLLALNACSSSDEDEFKFGKADMESALHGTWIGSWTPVNGTEAPFELAPAHQPELVLVGPAPSQERRAAWVAATDARQLTLVEGDPAVDLRALADRLAGRSLGLVLAGGGARAFAHVGVLRELEEAGLHVDRVAGSSIGAIIAAAHATGIDGAALEERCYLEWVRRQPFSDWRLPSTSFAKGHRVRAAPHGPTWRRDRRPA